MKKIEEKSIDLIVKRYGSGLQKRRYVLGVDNHSELNGACLVVYDVSELDNVWSAESLRKWCDSNGGDEENFEVDRVTLVEIDDF